MNIDNVEKLKEFPNFINYAKKDLTDFITNYFIFVILFGLLFDFVESLVIISIFYVVNTYWSYYIDGKIFKAFNKIK